MIGSVKPFPGVKTDKAQALKPLEEAAEAFGAWQQYNRLPKAIGELAGSRASLIYECCDVIQATCNLLASLGVYDVTVYMKYCEQRNRERGRYAD